MIFNKLISQISRRLPQTGLCLGWGSLLLAAMAGCGSETASARRPPPGPALIRVASIERKLVPPRVTIVGSVVPIRTSIVASGANGIVERFDVEQGQFIKMGHLLSQLRMVTTNLGIDEAEAWLRERKRGWDELVAGSRQEDKDEASAKMKATEAIMHNADNKLTRAKSLFERNAINQDERDDAQERAESARQAFLAARATYNRVSAGPRQEEIDRARARYEAQDKHVAFLKAEARKRSTRAPIDGYIVKEHTYRGEWLSKGDPVVTLARLDLIDVLANVDQRDERHVRLFDQAQVHIKGIQRPQWTGTIVAKVPRSEWQTGSRGFPVKVRLKNEFYTVGDQRLPLLKEGMMAEVTFTGTPVEALLVPKDAVVRTPRGSLIYLFDPLVVSRWRVQQADDPTGIIGNVHAVDEQRARRQAETTFSLTGRDDISVELAMRPSWAAFQTVPGDDGRNQDELLGYVDADSEELARDAAVEKFQLPEATQLRLTPQLGTVRQITVELGLSDGTSIQVIGDGIEPGRLMVTRGAERLRHFQDVKLTPDDPLQSNQPKSSDGGVGGPGK